MTAAKNPKLVFNPYKNNCNSKIKKIEAFIAANTGDLNAEKILVLKKLNSALGPVHTHGAGLGRLNEGNHR